MQLLPFNVDRLLTPPGTPLFPSSDGSESQLASVAPRSSTVTRSVSTTKASRVYFLFCAFKGRQKALVQIQFFFVLTSISFCFVVLVEFLSLLLPFTLFIEDIQKYITIISLILAARQPEVWEIEKSFLKHLLVLKYITITSFCHPLKLAL